MALRPATLASLSLLLALALSAGPARAQVGPPRQAPSPAQVPVVTPGPQDPALLQDPADGGGDDGWPDWTGDDPGAPGPGEAGYPLELVTTATVRGATAMLRTDGRAAIPLGAPKRVRDLVRAANQIVGKPYKWGGGHVRLGDRGYDCSGAVSYGLVKGGLLRFTMVSGGFSHWAAGGAGRWVTVYSTRSHVYMEVAGLRFDTSPYGDDPARDGVRWRPLVGRRAGFHARHPVRL